MFNQAKNIMFKNFQNNLVIILYSLLNFVQE